jgi:hypothetical protein
MSKNRTKRIAGLTTILILVVMLATFLAVQVAALAAPAPGETYIVRQPGQLPYFHPNTLSCQRGRVSNTCTITIKNTLASAESVTLNGTVLLTLAPHQQNTITYKKKGTYVYGLATTGDTHQLTVNVT